MVSFLSGFQTQSLPGLRAPFQGGMWLGTGLSGLVASHASFAWSTGGVALAYLVQTVVCVLYCYWVEKFLNRGRGSDEEACGSQLGGER